MPPHAIVFWVANIENLTDDLCVCHVTLFGLTAYPIVDVWEELLQGDQFGILVSDVLDVGGDGFQVISKLLGSRVTEHLDLLGDLGHVLFHAFHILLFLDFQPFLVGHIFLLADESFFHFALDLFNPSKNRVMDHFSLLAPLLVLRLGGP